MLSYRHAFHAGNHADVLKHFVLNQVLDYFTQKDKAFWYIDTHAGAGLYQLSAGFALQNAEFESGITRIAKHFDSAASTTAEALAIYLKMVKNISKNNELEFYPGSPMVAKSHLRAEDKMRLFERHPSDYKLLCENFKSGGRQIKIEPSDGFAGLKSLLPPPSKRAVVLIDPPYEEKQDYQRVVDSMQDSLSRFATGTYLVWYPLLQRPEPLQMLHKLKQIKRENWLDVSIQVESPSSEGFGMFGSGMFMINPPWTLPTILEATMPKLTELLAQDDSAEYTLESHIS